MGRILVGCFAVILGVLPYGLKIPGIDPSLDALVKFALVCTTLLGVKLLVTDSGSESTRAVERVNDRGHREAVMKTTRSGNPSRSGTPNGDRTPDRRGLGESNNDTAHNRRSDPRSISGRSGPVARRH